MLAHGTTRSIEATAEAVVTSMRGMCVRDRRALKCTEIFNNAGLQTHDKSGQRLSLIHI